MLERTPDGLVAGVFLTARDGRIVYMNAAAEGQIKTGNSIRIVNNRIFPTDSATRAALSKAIDEAAREDPDKGMSEYSLAIPDVEGGPGYVASLFPVEGGQRRDILAPFAASVAVFTQDPIQAPLMPGEAFARLYKLTGGELRVLLALAQGLGAKGGGRDARHQRADCAHPPPAHLLQDRNGPAGRPRSPVAEFDATDTSPAAASHSFLRRVARHRWLGRRAGEAQPEAGAEISTRIIGSDDAAVAVECQLSRRLTCLSFDSRSTLLDFHSAHHSV